MLPAGRVRTPSAAVDEVPAAEGQRSRAAGRAKGRGRPSELRCWVRWRQPPGRTRTPPLCHCGPLRRLFLLCRRQRPILVVEGAEASHRHRWGAPLTADRRWLGLPSAPPPPRPPHPPPRSHLLLLPSLPPLLLPQPPPPSHLLAPPPQHPPQRTNRRPLMPLCMRCRASSAARQARRVQRWAKRAPPHCWSTLPPNAPE